MNQIVYLVNVCEVIHVQNLITTIDKFLKLQNNLRVVREVKYRACRLDQPLLLLTARTT